MLQYYDSDHGADDILQGVTRLVDACMCMRRLHTIQDDVHEQLLTCQGLDGSAIACTEKYYCGKNSSRQQVATYLSSVVICVLQSL